MEPISGKVIICVLCMMNRNRAKKSLRRHWTCPTEWMPEAALRDSETARLRAILDYAAEGILAIDADSTVELCNAVAAHILGRTVAQILGSSLTSIPALTDLAQRQRPIKTGGARCQLACMNWKVP